MWMSLCVGGRFVSQVKRMKKHLETTVKGKNCVGFLWRFSMIYCPTVLNQSRLNVAFSEHRSTDKKTFILQNENRSADNNLLKSWSKTFDAKSNFYIRQRFSFDFSPKRWRLMPRPTLIWPQISKSLLLYTQNLCFNKYSWIIWMLTLKNLLLFSSL